MYFREIMIRTSPPILSKLLCLWPGLYHICFGSIWLGFILAITATISLNTAIIASILWTDLVPMHWQAGLWMITTMIWLVAATTTDWNTRLHPTLITGEQSDHLFRKAQDQFLNRDWEATEESLQSLLRFNPRDCDVLLQLATLYRHQDRPHEAHKTLLKCEEADSTGKWTWEVGQEKAQLTTLR